MIRDIFPFYDGVSVNWSTFGKPYIGLDKSLLGSVTLSEQPSKQG